MIATLADVWGLRAAAETTEAPAPEPKRRPPPVLMGDILLSFGGEPELLRHWREARDGAD